jgi:hypothetical protein
MKSLEWIKADEAKRIGRPPRSKSSADHRITIRLTAAELADWTKRAGTLSLSVWIRNLGNAAVRRPAPNRK